VKVIYTAANNNQIDPDNTPFERLPKTR